MTEPDKMIPAAHVAVDDEQIEAVARVLRSGRLREGPICWEFETRFAASVGARHAVSASSGTAALHLAYAALLQPGDEVLVPTFTFIATASMVAIAGGVPVFCDVRPDVLTIDLDDARRRITSRTRAIAPVHLFGNPCDVAGVQSLAEEFGLKVVWDAAQAQGAQYAGVDIGSLDTAVCFSFYPSKNMTTAEGGMVTTNDPDLCERLRMLRNHGSAAKYDHVMLGFNYRLTDVQAALGLGQLKHVSEWVAARRDNARRLTAHLAGIDDLAIPVEQPRGASSFNLYTIVLKSCAVATRRDEVVELLRERGIGVSVHYRKPLHRQPAFASLTADATLPVADELASRVLSLPVHPGVSPDQVEWMANAVDDVVGAVHR